MVLYPSQYSEIGDDKISAQLFPISGWSALLNGVLAIIGVVFLVLFFVIGQPFGTMNDLTSLPWVLSFLPVLWFFYRLGANEHKFISLIALGVGVFGLLGVFALQLLLVLKVITIWQQTYYITSAFGAIGLWMVIASGMGRAESFVSPALAGFGIALGAGWILATLCVWIGGFPPADGASSMSDMSQFNIITIIGISLIFLGYFVQPIWAIWLGRYILSTT